MDVSSLNNVFPKTIEILHEKNISYLQEQYRKTLFEQLLISTEIDSSRWFPVFLKFQGIRPEILEVAEYEYLKHLARHLDLGGIKMDEDQVILNPSLQFIELHHHQPKLDRTSGLYCFYKRQENLVEFKLSLQQALVIDVLHEERKYSLEQLVVQVAIHEMGVSQSYQNWRNTIAEMFELGILLNKR